MLGGRRPGDLCVHGELEGLYDTAPDGLDPEIVKALGVRTTLAALLEEPGGAEELLDRMADPERTLSRERLRELWRALAGADLDLEPPERVRALVDGEPEVVPAVDAIVVDRPDLLPLLARSRCSWCRRTSRTRSTWRWAARRCRAWSGHAVSGDPCRPPFAR